MVSGSHTPPTATVAPNPKDLVFGRYQSIRRLAVGGMGEVFLARQSGVAGFDRLVILKSLLPDLAAQQDFVDQFLDEARVAATLNHPNIVSIYEVGLWNGTYFIAMEYIKGDNLSRLQRAAERSKQRVPIDVATFIVHEAALALDHAHNAVDLAGKPLHIVHRDVSPQNIMVRTDGVTKVVDFGIAKAANRSSRTATGLLKGKVQYMAPEQVAGEDLDGRADQFALGVVLYELVAGRKLFSGKSDIEILKAVLQAPIPTLSEVDPSVSPALSACVARMLSRDRNERFPTLALAAQELKKVLDVGGIKNAQQHAAAFIADTIGAEIESKTIDLTPSSANNFVINLSNPGTAPTSMFATGGVSKARVGIIAGVLSAVVLGAAAFIVLKSPQAAPTPTTPIAPQQQRAAPIMAIDSIPAGAAVFLDGKEVGKAPMKVEQTPGVEQAFELRLPGYEVVKFSSKLAAGEIESFMKALVKLPFVLKLTSEPSGAEVKKDGAVLGKTPLELSLAADAPHDLRLTLGKKVAALSVQGKPGATEERRVVLREGRAAPAPVAAATPPPVVGDGMLTVKTTPWTKIAIDGKPYGSTPIANVKLSAGKHVVHLVNEEARVNEKRTITIKADEKAKFDWKLK